jgi:threonylcarbamoyladenosine tRNA methylthiotransferase MtaB
MRRPYTVAMYGRLVERLAAALPSAGIGADVIAGFPGETDDDFAATRDVVETLPLSYLHVFPYSARAGTEAELRPDQVDPRVAGRRARSLRDLGAAKSLAFRQGLIGHTEDVLVLDTHDRVSGHRLGLTGNYVEVGFDARSHTGTRVARVRITGVDGERTMGCLASFHAVGERSVA